MPGIYIMSHAPRSGKTLVVLGIMEALAGRVQRLSVFRPLVREGEEKDRLITLVAARYPLQGSYEDMYGTTYIRARELLTAGRQEDLYREILERFRKLESASDIVVCVGSDYQSVSSALEFDFNIEAANNLGTPIIPIINGRDKIPALIVDMAKVVLNSLKAKKIDPLSLVVNRVQPDEKENMFAALTRAFPEVSPIHVLPENPLLDTVSVREIADALKAEMISGDPAWLEGEVKHIKIAAMELPHFLDHIEDGVLVITPGDRSDIILGSLTADMSRNYPRIAGLLLTGGIPPAQQIRTLIDGLDVAPVPVLGVRTDTFTTAMNVHAVEPSIVHGNTRKIAAVLGMVESSVDLPALLERIAVARTKKHTPLMFQYELIERSRRQRRHIVLPEGEEERILRAAEIVILRGICDITLLGNPEEIRRKINSLGLSLGDVKIIDPVASDLRKQFAGAYFEARKHKGISSDMAFDTMSDVSYFGTMMVQLGHADGMVSGSVHTTAHTIRPALEFVKTKPGISIVSSVFFMCLADQVLVYGDCAINPEPTAEQLADIAVSSAETARAFGVEPRVAMLSYSTGESGKGPEVDKVRTATEIAHERRPDLKIEGPIQYDAAVDTDVAKVKLPKSEVAGHATVFVFPDLNAGNNAYKAVQRSANALAIGPVLQGLNKPVNDLSRGATVPDIVNTIAITAIQAQTEGGQ
jgi:phosphate acetyltransferase